MMSSLASLRGLRGRLTIEFVILVGLLMLSAVIWRPGFYRSEERRCLELARIASTAISHDQKTRERLDREAAWLARRASDLRWRGLWIGLTRGPKTRDDEMMGNAISIYELGTLEAVDMHEMRLRRLLGAGTGREEESSIPGVP
jgi:hypothetical protein